MTERAEARCPHCGGTELVQDLRLNLTAEVGAVGLSYRAAWLFHGTEPLVADLCRTCGTVVRLFVRDPGRKWLQKP